MKYSFFTVAMGIVGGIGLVTYAIKKDQPGKLFWFAGGYMLGAIAGSVIDQKIAKQ